MRSDVITEERLTMSKQFVPSFSSLHLQGGLFARNFFQALLQKDSSVLGLAPETYECSSIDRLEQTIQTAWEKLSSLWNTLHPSSFNKLSLEALQEQWLFPFFQELGYKRLYPSKEEDIHPDAQVYSWRANPFVFLRPYCAVGKKTFSQAQYRLQDFLNKAELPLWGVLTNGRVLRLFSQSVTLTRETYLEFDLDAIFQTQSFLEFRILWLMCHKTRFERVHSQECWLEQWSKFSQKHQWLPELRQQIKKAILFLGQGFLKHPENAFLLEKIDNGKLTAPLFYQQLLQVLTRLLFLWNAEKRNRLKDPKSSDLAYQKYQELYSIEYLRQLAQNPNWLPPINLWKNQVLLFEHLGRNDGFAEIGIPALGGLFWSFDQNDLGCCSISNENFINSIACLTSFSSENLLFVELPYHELGLEILGNLYDSLLGFYPQFSQEKEFLLELHEEGSYYPSSMINRLLNSVLEPLLKDILQKEEPEQALLQFKICDPACGSGYFLIATANRLARHLAILKTGKEHPSPKNIQQHLRQVISACLYGVDVHPIAIELCKFNLWLESLEAGLPLPFLAYHIQQGNSLLGATPALLKKGIPDDAFRPLAGDNEQVCSQYRQKNQKERNEFLTCLSQPTPIEYLNNLSQYFEELEQLPEDTLEQVLFKKQRYEDIHRSHSYLYRRIWADAWCAVFVWKKNETHLPLITEALFHEIERNPYSLTVEMMTEVRGLAQEYQFFHWHLAFPSVFRLPENETVPQNLQTGWCGGFDLILGDPPWQYTFHYPQEWLKTHRAKGEQFSSSQAQQAEEILTRSPTQLVHHFINSSKKYPRCERNYAQPYEVFLENNQLLSSLNGRVGCLVFESKSLEPQEEKVNSAKKEEDLSLQEKVQIVVVGRLADVPPASAEPS